MKTPNFADLCGVQGRVVAKNGWCNATKFEIQASAAEDIAKRLTLRADAIYKIACEADVFLLTALPTLIPHNEGYEPLVRTANVFFACVEKGNSQPLLDFTSTEFEKLSERPLLDFTGE